MSNKERTETVELTQEEKRQAQDIYEKATLIELGSNANGTRHEIVLRAIHMAKNLSGSCEGWMSNEQLKEMTELFDNILYESFEYISSSDYHKAKNFIQFLNKIIKASSK